MEYLTAVQQAIINQTTQQNIVMGIQWLDVGKLDDEELQVQMLHSVDIATEGFITILQNTKRFLHARYYATRSARLRLKDKFYLFLCEREQPEAFLANEILQFYPHHLMVVPESPVEKASTTKTKGRGAQALNCSQQSEMNQQSTCHHKYTINRSQQYMYFFFGNNDDNNELNTDLYYHHINFELWTQKFIGIANNSAAIYLDAFLPNKTFQRNVELYPNKLLNLDGRTLRVGSITYIPYVFTNYVATGSGNVDSIYSNDGNLSVLYVGSEANLVRTFCEVHNCHLRLAAYGDDNWGGIYENDTADGMLGDLYMQRVELAIGCIYNWYDNLTETSHTIARSAVTILGPAPALFPAWRTCIMPFTNGLWLLLILTMLLCSFLMFFIKVSLDWFQGQRKVCFWHKLPHAFLNIFAVFIQQPSAEKSLNRFAARIFMAILLCATITLENTYSGQLKSILTLPFYEEPVDTMYKWSFTDWKWAAPSIIWIQTVEKSDLKTEQILTRKFEIRDYDYLYNASFRHDYGLGIERLLSGSFSFGNYITASALETKIVPKDDLYFDWTRAVAIRGWPLMPLFDKHVRVCMETGLFIHWEREMVSTFLDRQTQDIMLNLASGETVKSSPQKLTISNISGAIFALCIGYLLSGAVFLLELCSHAFMGKWKFPFGW